MNDTLCIACRVPLVLVALHLDAHSELKIFECARCKSRASVTTFPAYRTSPAVRDYVQRKRAGDN